jgi:hypothetical protein
MYWNVPSSVPSAVSPRVAVGECLGVRAIDRDAAVIVRDRRPGEVACHGDGLDLPAGAIEPREGGVASSGKVNQSAAVSRRAPLTNESVASEFALASAPR